MLDLVVQIAQSAYKVTQEDIDGLRRHGFTDEEIVDIVLAASARSFMSKALDGLGAQADAEYLTDPVLSRAASFPR